MRMMHGLLYKSVRQELKQKLSPEQVRNDLLQRHAYARDAGFYRLVPRTIVKARCVEDISSIFKIAVRRNRKLVFRAGGTSLSGQSVGDDILVEVRQGWQQVEILNEGKQIKLQAGVVAAKANQHLEPLGYRIGPDPGSIRSALIGGIVANNASGIGSGYQYNSYQTLAAMEMVLANGLILDTAEPHCNEKLHGQAPEIYAGLLKLRDKVRANPELKQKIRSKYRLKNTMGYSLNSFLDYDTPLDILVHLMVGSEGTLGFISSVTFNTVARQAFRATTLLLLPSLDQAARLVPLLKKTGTYALEIMDVAALQAVRKIPGLPGELRGELSEDAAALLVEFRGQDREDLANKVLTAEKIIKEKQPELRFRFYKDALHVEKLWKARQELGPLHAADRQAGTILISEDICVRVKDLVRTIKDLRRLFRRYHFEDAVIFGHAGDGNLHFKLSVDFSLTSAVERYGDFMQDLATLIIDRYHGSLKAEHGTGRNMAPFVEKEWGSDAYEIMQEIKQLLDPSGILNPDVLISSDPRIHLKHIKAIPLVNPIIDQCIECGLCEPWCPSADLSLSPRQRINVLRELEILKVDISNGHRRKKIRKAFQYEGLQTCATDGLCALSCPIDIDTGLLVKVMRAERQGYASRWLAGMIQRNFSRTLSLIRVLLQIFTPLRLALSNQYFAGIQKFLIKLTHGAVPALNEHLKAGTSIPKQEVSDEQVDLIYFPSCLNRGLSNPDRRDLSAFEAFAQILAAADLKYAYPRGLDDLCCGLSFSSKGFPDMAQQAAVRTTEMLWFSSQEGRLPIVMDTSPCSNHLKHYDEILSGVHLAKWRELKILDMVEYLHDTVLKKIDLTQVQDKVVLHPTCSIRAMGLSSKMEAIARRCAKEVIIPIDLGCCAFAGDRGLLVPELTESATRAEAQEVRDIPADGHYSTSRTCEIGMSLATRESYQSLVYLVHEALS